MARFIGYNTKLGSRMYGTLAQIPLYQCIEMPICENLMIGMAIGMALEGYKPVVCFERHDFLLLALDALVNHVDKLPGLSGWKYKLPIIIRAIVGGKSPLNAGPQHTQEYTNELRKMLRHTPVWDLQDPKYIVEAWDMVGNTSSGAVVIVEHKDLYDKEYGDNPPNSTSA